MEEDAARRQGIIYRTRDSHETTESTQDVQPVSHAVHNEK